jgi:hypothetical protein
LTSNLMADKEVHELTFEFGSLLGGGDTPSWLMPPSAAAGAAQHQNQNERPFAALFD